MDPQTAALEFASDSLWAHCTELAQAADRTRGAVGYAGRHAPEVLPLKCGDVVVVDASTHSLKTGSTSPDGIQGWLDQGATVYSLQGLHAKVLRFSLGEVEATVVGSGNASAHSRDDLIEAGLITYDRDAAAAVDAFLDKSIAQALEPLDAVWVARARKIYRAPRPDRPRRQDQTILPTTGRKLWVSSWIDDTLPPSAEAEAALAAASEDFANNVALWVWGLNDGDDVRVKDNDGLVLYTIPNGADKGRDGRWSVQVGRIVRVVTHCSGPPEAVVAFDRDLPTLRLRQVVDLYDAHEEDWDPETPILPGNPLLAALIELWRR